jgi:hypothetical protein
MALREATEGRRVWRNKLVITRNNLVISWSRRFLRPGRAVEVVPQGRLPDFMFLCHRVYGLPGTLARCPQVPDLLNERLPFSLSARGVTGAGWGLVVAGYLPRACFQREHGKITHGGNANSWPTRFERSGRFERRDPAAEIRDQTGQGRGSGTERFKLAPLLGVRQVAERQRLDIYDRRLGWLRHASAWYTPTHP